MRLIYFDGTFESCGHLLHACSAVDSRVIVVVDRKLSAEHRAFLSTCEDCGGSLGRFENGRFVTHVKVGSKRLVRHTSEKDGIELFLQHVAERDDLNDEEKLDLLHVMSVCDKDGCSSCSTCRRTRSLAEAYGFYDFVEWAPTFSGV